MLTLVNKSDIYSSEHARIMEELRKDISQYFANPLIVKANLSLALLNNFKGGITENKKEMLLRVINSIEYNKITNISQINTTMLQIYKDNLGDSGYNEIIHSINDRITRHYIQMCLGNCIHTYMKIRNPKISKILQHSDDLQKICNILDIPFEPQYRSHMDDKSIEWLTIGSSIVVGIISGGAYVCISAIGACIIS